MLFLFPFLTPTLLSAALWQGSADRKRRERVAQEQEQRRHQQDEDAQPHKMEQLPSKGDHFFSNLLPSFREK